MKTDAISLYAKASPDYAAKLAHTQHLIARAASEHPSVTLACSLGAEDMVLVDLIARAKLPISIFVLQTGALHAQTLALIDRAEAHYRLSIERYEPTTEAVIEFVQRNGELAMRQSVALRKACCGIRKLVPLERALNGKSAWITGLRRDQSQGRADVLFEEIEANGRIKFNPLADWTQGDVWHHIAAHNVPFNPLHDQFYPSIGCAPCTRAVALGEDIRAGRWWWEQEGNQECGLHVKKTEEPEGVAA
jgi:phosphoadenosine phosphosulfate reductase